MRLTERTRQTVSLKNANDEIEQYQVLEMFPFTSETKKMGILLKFEAEGGNAKYIYLVKGAEVVIEPKISHHSRITCSEACEEFATEGLRTLVFAQKVLTAEEAELF